MIALLSVIILMVFMAYGFLVLSGEIKTADAQMLLLIGNVTGSAQTFAGVVVAYWFGTTRGSGDKDKVIQSMASEPSKATATVQATIQTQPQQGTQS